MVHSGANSMTLFIAFIKNPCHGIRLDVRSKTFKAKVRWFHDEDDDITPLADAKKVMDENYPHVDFVITRGLGHRQDIQGSKGFKICHRIFMRKFLWILIFFICISNIFRNMTQESNDSKQ